MTGGRAVILGKTGRNFAAGMSGGMAYVLDEDGTFENHCNPETVDLEPLENDEDIDEVKQMIHRHAEYTKSDQAWHILADWDEYVKKIVKVFPKDYKRMLEQISKAEQEGLSGDDALMAAFEANKNDLARVSGN